MRKVIKKIPGFFLWAAWLVMTVHLLIPHDHHLSDSDGTRESTCPYSQEAEKHSSGFPVHCHAFNNLTSERAITFLLTINLRSDDFILGDIYKSDEFGVTSKIEYYDFLKPPPDSEILELSSLRAPPVLI